MLAVAKSDKWCSLDRGWLADIATSSIHAADTQKHRRESSGIDLDFLILYIDAVIGAIGLLDGACSENVEFSSLRR